MPRISWKCFSLLAMLVLAGCATPNVDQNVAPSQLANTGLVFASVSTSVEYRFGPIALFNFKKGGIAKSREEHIPGATLKPSELQEDYGRLVVLEMPAGANSLQRWHVAHGTTHYTPRQDFPEINFMVEPGKALYLGNLHVHVRMGRNFVNQPVIGDLVPEIRDFSDRDVAMLKSRYPNIGDNEIILEQPFLGLWSPTTASTAP